jgi:hypothetical protein
VACGNFKAKDAVDKAICAREPPSRKEKRCSLPACNASVASSAIAVCDFPNSMLTRDRAQRA